MARVIAKALGILGAALLGAACSSLATACAPTPDAPTPPDFDRIADPGLRRVVLFVGDGMGYASVEAAGSFVHGVPGSLAMESMPRRARVATASAYGETTDSAAAATAMATGSKVRNGAVGVALPGDGSALRTVLEHFAGRGWATGLVTTSFVYDATPAAFAAHAPRRSDYGDIIGDYLNISRPEVLLGAVRDPADGLVPAAAAAAGYRVAVDREALLAARAPPAGRLSGQFGGPRMRFELDGAGSEPRLREMVSVALDLLDDDPDGLFLLAEGGLIDLANHDNDIERSVRETAELDAAVQVALAWARGRDDTLIVATADHETGGLRVLGPRGAGFAPEVSWSTRGHTSAEVPLYAWGRGSEAAEGILDISDIAWILVGADPRASRRAATDFVAQRDAGPVAASTGVAPE